MRVGSIAITIAIVSTALATLARAETFPSTLEMRLQNRLLSEALLPGWDVDREPGVDRDVLREYFHRSASDPGGNDYLAARTDRLYGIERYEVSRMAVALEAAEFGASAALFAGALAETFGLWDEDVSWKLIGAAAAAGALWGGTVRAEDPKWRVRYRWEP
jgi:hypothetical protein